VAAVKRLDGSTSKLCPGCGRTLSLRAFNKAHSDAGFVVLLADGKRRYRRSRCRRCEAKYRREHVASLPLERRREQRRIWSATYEARPGVIEARRARQSTPEFRAKRRAAYAAKMAKLRADREALEAHRELGRLYAYAQRRRRGVPERQFRDRQTPGYSRDWLPREPFIEWVEHVRPHYPELTDDAFGEMLGFTARSLRRVMQESTNGVTVELVDRALTLEGSTELWQLYPDRFGVDAAA
jgi:hypothetical protein